MDGSIKVLVAIDLGDLVQGEFTFLVHLDELGHVFWWVAVTFAEPIVGLAQADSIVNT